MRHIATFTHSICSQKNSPAKWEIGACDAAGSSRRIRKEFAVSLGCDMAQAERIAYANALNLVISTSTSMGPGCTAWAHRVLSTARPARGE
ncbi:short-chain fatty acyl-CoA regulator family protein [Corynebacterium macginleyi]|uniref:short-chain fatty acyl-CoA regulator family protein n=1 Tax=Corynebacterium macginleyi TaxID=38290 RepID=UPI002279456E|nr:short-chain fatty acyl-CoA regulator family protein [Corynebacterium macginleyi]